MRSILQRFTNFCCLSIPSTTLLWSNPEDVNLSIVDPETMAEGFACPSLHTAANGQHRPAKAYDAPECRVLETISFPQRYNVVLEEDDDSLQQERLECSIVVQGCMAQHRCATMYGSRDAKSRK